MRLFFWLKFKAKCNLAEDKKTCLIDFLCEAFATEFPEMLAKKWANDHHH